MRRERGKIRREEQIANVAAVEHKVVAFINKRAARGHVAAVTDDICFFHCAVDLLKKQRGKEDQKQIGEELGERRGRASGRITTRI